MKLETFFIIAFLVVIVGVPVMLIMWSNQKKQLGTIQCRRCHHVGPAKGLFVPFRGVKPVCRNCQSEDWVKVDSKQS